MSSDAGKWLGMPVLERARRVLAYDLSANGKAFYDGWGDHARACLAEGKCPVCLAELEIVDMSPVPELIAVGGECFQAGCPAAPCYWRADRDGAFMWRPLAPWPESYPA